MRIREYIQENSIAIGASGTFSYDLDYTDPITQIDLYFEATNGAGYNKENPPERCISKVEIVDGGEVLWDLPGEVLFALYATDNEGFPYQERSEMHADSIRQCLPIRFGRWLFDPDYAFDPRKHKHPQLRFTYNEAEINDANGGGYDTGTWRFTLHVRLMENNPPVKGFMSARTIQSFTSVAGGDRRIQLPTDRPIRYLICRAYEHDIAMYTSLTNHRLTADGGKWVGFNLPARDFLNLHTKNWKPLWLNSMVTLSNGVATEHWVGISDQGSVSQRDAGFLVGGVFYMYGSVYGRVTSYDGTAASNKSANLCVHGWAFHNTLIYPFGDRMKPADWLDPKGFGQLDYFVNDGNADADVDICLQQLYRY